MHIHAFGIRATIVLRDEFLSWKVLRDAKSMGTAALDYQFSRVAAHMNIYVGSEAQDCAAAVTNSDTWISQGNWFDI